MLWPLRSIPQGTEDLSAAMSISRRVPSNPLYTLSQSVINLAPEKEREDFSKPNPLYTLAQSVINLAFHTRD